MTNLQSKTNVKTNKIKTLVNTTEAKLLLSVHAALIAGATSFVVVAFVLTFPYSWGL